MYMSLGVRFAGLSMVPTMTPEITRAPPKYAKTDISS